MDPLTLIAILLFLGPGAATFVLAFRFGQTGLGSGLFMLIVGLVLYHYRKAVLVSLLITHPIAGINVSAVVAFFALHIVASLMEWEFWE